MKVYLKIFLFLAIFMALSLPSLVSAADVRGDNDIFIPEDEVIGDNLYLGAGKANLKGQIDADLTAAAGELTSSSTIAGDASIVGGNINIGGITEGDLRIVGGDVTVSGNVNGELFITEAKVLAFRFVSIIDKIAPRATRRTIEKIVIETIISIKVKPFLWLVSEFLFFILNKVIIKKF